MTDPPEFNPYNPDHLEAWVEFQRTGVWPVDRCDVVERILPDPFFGYSSPYKSVTEFPRADKEQPMPEKPKPKITFAEPNAELVSLYDVRPGDYIQDVATKRVILVAGYRHSCDQPSLSLVCDPLRVYEVLLLPIGDEINFWNSVDNTPRYIPLTVEEIIFRKP